MNTMNRTGIERLKRGRLSRGPLTWKPKKEVAVVGGERRPATPGSFSLFHTPERSHRPMTERQQQLKAHISHPIQQLYLSSQFTISHNQNATQISKELANERTIVSILKERLCMGMLQVGGQLQSPYHF